MWKLSILLLALMAQGCAVGYYGGKADGETTVYGMSLFSDNALDKGSFKLNADKSRSMEFDGASTEQIESLKQINQGLSLIIEGAVKGLK